MEGKFGERRDDVTEAIEGDLDSDLSDPDSLFDEPSDVDSHFAISAAQRTAPPIHGLYLISARLLPLEVARHVMQRCMDVYFKGGANQIMLFDRAGGATSLPDFLTGLLAYLFDFLRTEVPPHIHELLFPAEPPRARQVILNLYRPGEGISAHVDLLNRFGDGILGVSLGSGCVMRFESVSGTGEQSDRMGPLESHTWSARDAWDVYLPEGSVLVLSGDARYRWKHGIEGRRKDFVQINSPDSNEKRHSNAGEWIARDVRVSITFRWLLAGAEIVGE